jgi:hypothetical protein
MIAVVRRAWDNFRGGGDAAVTVPPMDGMLRPNQRIEEAETAALIPQPDNLVSASGEIRLTSGEKVFALDRKSGLLTELAAYDAPIVSMAAAEDGTIALGLEQGGIRIVGGGRPDRSLGNLTDRRIGCPIAMHFETPRHLLLAEGSRERPAREWKTDLLQRRATGSVWRLDLESGKTDLIADGLAWPYGLAPRPDGGIVVSESWRHRLVELTPAAGPPKTLLEDLPGYPSRVTRSANGGFWLCVFAPRSQLVEFIQRETKFRRLMMQEVESDYWIAPALGPSKTFLEPLQGGGLKHLGILKPWAPSRSYGLVIRLDDALRPTASYHSRADGERHGVTSAVESDGKLLISSKGGNAVVSLPL